jgi:taurine---2-oxoglutarate transaminase
MATLETNSELGRQVVADAKQYVLHSWSVQDALDPIPVAGGEGRYFWDYDGKRYLDFASQLVNVSIGHQHPKIVAAIKEQAEKLCTIGPPMATEARSTLARLLAEVTPGDLQMSFFTNGGAEANENAVKLARWYTGRHKVIARYRSYHGATAGAITLTGDPRRWPAEPGIPGVVRMLDPYTYRCPAGHPDPCPVCTGAPHLEEILQYEGAHTVAAVILEPVVGTNGIIVPPDGYLQAIREVCDRHGILLIADEVMAGFGRTGKWFGVENWNVVPDILTVAKGINSGYVPLGAMIVRKPIADWVRDKYFAGGLTYSGHPLACASAVASIEAFKEEGVVENSAEMGGVFAEKLRELQGKHPSIGDLRGLGCFWGIELVKDRETREPLVPFNASGEAFAPVARVSRAALERGLYLMTHWNVIMVCPPLTITREEIDEGIGVLDEALSIADEYTA